MKNFPGWKFANWEIISHTVDNSWQPLPNTQTPSASFMLVSKGDSRRPYWTLELIELDDCTKSLSESAKKIKENQESYGNYALQVRIGHEAIENYNINEYISHVSTSSSFWMRWNSILVSESLANAHILCLNPKTLLIIFR